MAARRIIIWSKRTEPKSVRLLAWLPSATQAATVQIPWRHPPLTFDGLTQSESTRSRNWLFSNIPSYAERLPWKHKNLEVESPTPEILFTLNKAKFLGPQPSRFETLSWKRKPAFRPEEEVTAQKFRGWFPALLAAAPLVNDQTPWRRHHELPHDREEQAVKTLVWFAGLVSHVQVAIDQLAWKRPLQDVVNKGDELQGITSRGRFLGIQPVYAEPLAWRHQVASFETEEFQEVRSRGWYNYLSSGIGPTLPNPRDVRAGISYGPTPPVPRDVRAGVVY